MNLTKSEMKMLELEMLYVECCSELTCAGVDISEFYDAEEYTRIYNKIHGLKAELAEPRTQDYIALLLITVIVFLSILKYGGV